MGLLDEIEAAAKPTSACKFGRWLADQDSKYQAEISQALAGDYPTRTIWRVLTDRHGLFVSATVFDRHRNRSCGCELG